MAWPTDSYSGAALARGDFAPDEALSQTRARGLRDIQVIATQAPMAIPDFSDSESGTTFVDAVTFELEVPESWEGRTLHVEILAHNDSGGGAASGDAGEWRVREDGSGTNGTATAVADSVTAAAASEATLDINASWIDTRISIALQVRKTQAGAYTFDTSATQRLTMWVE